MALRNRNEVVRALFYISVIGKAIDGALEIIGGIILFIVNPGQINWMLRVLTQHELSEDPYDVIAGLVLRSVQHLSTSTQAFAAFFLLWHGVVKVGLVWALLRKQLWAYPTAIIVFGLFLAYQIYRYTHTHSVWLIALSIIDVFVIVLTWLEYKRLRVLFSHAFR